MLGAAIAPDVSWSSPGTAGPGLPDSSRRVQSLDPNPGV